MSDQITQTLKGFRDFLPQEKRARDFVTQKVTAVFETYGFEPLETPTLEYASLLLGKYGDEADKLVYAFEDRGGRSIALRYDQTVPTARVLAQYQNELPRYFRRYQIQNVFRADKPQKGRFREFTQCDIDIFGSTSPLADAEIIACTYSSFAQVGFDEIEIRINDRQTLMSALEAFATERVNVFSIIQSIDKLDKITEAEVVADLVEKGLSPDSAVTALANIKNAELSDNLLKIVQNLVDMGVPKQRVKITPTLARGLDYYTGMIFEIILPQYPVGSCAGGGRYDNLIQQLGGVDVPAVGVAFGFDRMVEAALELGLIPDSGASAQVLVTIFDESMQPIALQTATELRQAGIPTEIYPSNSDALAKQFKMANQKQIPFVVIIGEDEYRAGKVALKNMTTGEQELLSLAEVIARMSY